jgi:hypothetical protein
VQIIRCVEDPEVIEKIFTCLDVIAVEPEGSQRRPSQAPPQQGGELITERAGTRVVSTTGLLNPYDLHDRHRLAPGDDPAVFSRDLSSG